MLNHLYYRIFKEMDTCILYMSRILYTSALYQLDQVHVRFGIVLLTCSHAHTISVIVYAGIQSFVWDCLHVEVQQNQARVEANHVYEVITDWGAWLQTVDGGQGYRFQSALKLRLIGVCRNADIYTRAVSEVCYGRGSIMRNY